MNLKEIRKQKGVSQADVALAVGVTVPAVSSWESGRFSPSLENLIKTAAYLDCTVDELIGGEDGKDPEKES